MSSWIVVSNRLPFSYDEEKKVLAPSSGGLVTAICGIKTNNQITWVGSLPNNIPRKLVKNSKDQPFHYSFPEIDEKLYDSYYNDFCNNVLWPILHYESELIRFHEAGWKSYCEVNRIFAEHIARIANDDDYVWLHDFHFFLVPKLLKKLNPKIKVGFFLHVPFPSSEIYRQLPHREEIVESLIHADLVGFHDFSYLRHFASSVYELLGIHSGLLEIRSHFNTTKLGVFPVGIDTKAFMTQAASRQTQKEIERYRLKENDHLTILGIDRLDYTKGIPYKLEAFKKFLELNPHYVGKVQLLQVAIPSRTEVEDYINLRHEVERLVSEINGRFGQIDYIPVNYIFNSVSKHELLALYRSARVLFVTSKRDGMNLVSLEYIAAQHEQDPGVVLLSEFTGAASTLSHAMLINPMDIDRTASQLGEALEMKLEKRKENYSVMIDYLKGYTASTWAQAFIQNLASSSTRAPIKSIDLQEAAEMVKLRDRFKGRPKVLMLDYDGTLTPIVNQPHQAILDAKTRALLKKLSKRKDIKLVIVSGRPADFLLEQFEGIDCYLACEHGAKFFDYQLNRWRSLVSSNRREWYKGALEIIQDYNRRTPNSFYEKKNYAISWHYRNSPKNFAEFQARKLVVELESGLAHLPVSVILGKKVVEVKSLEANKGYFAQWFVSRYVQADEEVLAIGDDQTDEDLFEGLAQKGVTVKVGEDAASKAKYFVSNQGQVNDLLRLIL